MTNLDTISNNSSNNYSFLLNRSSPVSETDRNDNLFMDMFDVSTLMMELEQGLGSDKVNYLKKLNKDIKNTQEASNNIGLLINELKAEGETGLTDTRKIPDDVLASLKALNLQVDGKSISDFIAGCKPGGADNKLTQGQLEAVKGALDNNVTSLNSQSSMLQMDIQKISNSLEVFTNLASKMLATLQQILKMIVQNT